jgi:hypothetical protein
MREQGLASFRVTCTCYFLRLLPQVEAAQLAAWNEVLQIEQTPAGN